MKGTIHHIEIYVSNLPQTRKFYQWLLVEELGYSLFQDWDEGFSFKMNHTYIVFVQTEEKYDGTPYHRKQSGLNHLAFFVDTEKEVDALRKKLKRKDIPVLYDENYPNAGGIGYYAVYFEDPNRLKLEVVAKSES